MSRPTALAISAARQRQLDPDALAAAKGRLRLDDVVDRVLPSADAAPPRLREGAAGVVVEAMTRRGGAAPGARRAAAPAASPAPTTGTDEPVTLDDAYPAHERVTLTAMRRTIAARLARSKAEAPHYYMSIDVGLDALVSMRTDFNRLIAPAKLSMNDVFVHFVARTLTRHPAINAAWLGDAIARFEQVNLAVAVSIDAGLVTPVLRDAASLGLRRTADALAELIDAARRRALGPNAFRGGTFTISNLGMYGVREFAAILNPPQAAILGIAGPRREVVPDGDRGTRIEQRTTLTLSVDHRVADGVAGAEFLDDLKRALEEPRRALL